MSKEYYVILTGSKNNAGDFLIKYRAKQLFKELRKDRDIIDFNAWEYIDDKKLEIVNNAKALILMGGPALQKNMYPGIYKLRENLNDIKVPIVMMGIGWKSMQGNWANTYNYDLNNTSMQLLKRIDNSGYISSVRDYHTLSVLNTKGFKNVFMTGCPAYYDSSFINSTVEINKIEKIAFSLGVSFVESTSMEKLMKENILHLRKKFKDKQFEVAFHHSLDSAKFLKTGSAPKKHNLKHNQFAKWLRENDINYVDISGSAENLINYYEKIDLHIGYRVHAHIFMNSISKFSILLSEDGRAKALKDVIGGIVLDGYFSFRDGFISKVLNKLIDSYDRYVSNKYLSEEILLNINYEKEIDYVRIKNSRSVINNNFKIMKKFLSKLA